MMKRFLVALLAILALAGCGGSKSTGGGTATSAPQTTPGQTANSGQAGLVVDVTINNGNVTPTNAKLQAKVHQPIEFRVSSDAADELHVHSVPDHMFPIEAKLGQTFQFSVDVPGQVDVELHHLDKTVATISVQP